MDHDRLSFEDSEAQVNSFRARPKMSEQCSVSFACQLVAVEKLNYVLEKFANLWRESPGKAENGLV